MIDDDVAEEKGQKWTLVGPFLFVWTTYGVGLALADQ